MSKRELIIRNYETPTGIFPFEEWVLGLKDRASRAAIYARLGRVRQGNFGNCRPVGEGVLELKIHLGPGFRVYFACPGLEIVLLLCGGTKRGQSSDIRRAKELWNEYQERKKYGPAHEGL